MFNREFSVCFICKYACVFVCVAFRLHTKIHCYGRKGQPDIYCWAIEAVKDLQLAQRVSQIFIAGLRTQ